MSSSLDRKIMWLLVVAFMIFGLSTVYLHSHLHILELSVVHVVPPFVLPLPVGAEEDPSSESSLSSAALIPHPYDDSERDSNNVLIKNTVSLTTFHPYEYSSHSDASDLEYSHLNPFPQSIYNEDWEQINHPIMDLVQEAQQVQQGRLQHALKVPRFWNPTFSLFQGDIRNYLGNYGQTLLTPIKARQIGSYTTPTKDYDQQEPDIIEEEEKATDDKYVIVTEKTVVEQPPDHNDKLETIFISIISYQDSKRCQDTLKQIFKQATFPERIRVAVVNQIQVGTQNTDNNNHNHHNGPYCAKPHQSCHDNPNQILCEYSHLIDEYILDTKMAIGPMFARHIGSRMYRGEYYAMQIDSRMEFVIEWDVLLINQWKATNNEMAVLSSKVGYVAGRYNETTGMAIQDNVFKLCNITFDDSSTSTGIGIDTSKEYYDMLLVNEIEQPEGPPEPTNNGEPMLQPLWINTFSFARGHFIVQVPYDPYLPFISKGEDHNIGLRGFTYGYDYYSPQKTVLFRYWSENTNMFGFSEHSLNGSIDITTLSKKRLLGITEMLYYKNNTRIESSSRDTNNNDNHDSLQEWNKIETKQYGLGHVRKVSKLLDTYGIHVNEKSVESNLCNFVGTPMNKMFLPYLRNDGMGIDYDKINFQYMSATSTKD